MRLVPCTIALLIGSAAFARGPNDNALTFEARVRAQEAIERVYYRHQIGATKTFEQAVPRAVLENKVRKVLRQSALLRTHGNTPLTDAMLQQELARMASGTRMPDRLVELYAALGNDPFLIKECLARAGLVERLTRDLDASALPSFDVETVGSVAVKSTPLPMPKSTASIAGLPCPADDTWSNGVLDAVPDSRWFHTGVWTGSLMVVWGGNRGGQFGGSLDTGGRYDPATDTWSPTSLVGAPSARVDHSTVWTGSLMIVWGGGSGDGPAVITGGRYDPVSDTWTPTSVTNAPTGRQYQSVVWTGTRMIIWGGNDSLKTGALYDPESDTWTPTSTTGAPQGRGEHSAVWTGTEMIIWGGAYNTIQGQIVPLGTGGRYDPATDTWAGMTWTAAPSERSGHTAVWTGNRMLVWGGGWLNTGGLYDPATDTWQPMATVGAPSGRNHHSAIWTGSRMLIWGGFGINGVPTNTGGRYDPVTNSWASMSTIAAAPASAQHVAVWTGSRMVVWGGASNSGVTDTGGRYDPATDLWAPMSPSTAPGARNRHTAVWTGSEMLVWGGLNLNGTTLNTGGRYDPATDTWSPTSLVGAPSARSLHTAVWTGDRMVVWGGTVGGGIVNTGARYDPLTDAWTPTSTVGAPAPRSSHAAVWTGSRMVVLSGAGADPKTGGRYDPATDTWTPTAIAGAPPESHQTAVWTGSIVLVWGGAGDFNYSNTGGRYDPAADAWTPISTVGAPTPRTRHTAVWTGSRMVVWGGSNFDPDLETYVPTNTGGNYDPATDTWTPTSLAGAPAARLQQTAVWAGSAMVLWGGAGVGSGNFPSGGGRYDPVADSWAPVTVAQAPNPRSNHTAVWTGSVMMVWGGAGSGGVVRSGGGYVLGASVDGDGDGYSECQLDCNDSNAGIHPYAVESCNGIDDDCNGLVDDGAGGLDPDADGRAGACDVCPQRYDPAQSDFDHDGQGDLCDVDDGLIYVLPLDKNYRDWQPEAGATTWNSYRGSLTALRATGQYTQVPGSNPLAARDCGVAAPSVFDPLVPDPGEVAFHLVTAVVGGIEGGLGTDSAGAPRLNANPCP